MARKSKVSARFPSRDVFFGTSADLPRIVELDTAMIAWNPDQPRKNIDPVRLRELAESIAANGLIHPITVKLIGEGRYQVIAGERRLRALRLLRRATIPAIISAGTSDELALIENIQREDLSAIDEFRAVARLMEKHGYSQGEVASALGRSRVSINELMGLSRLALSIVNEAQRVGTSKSTLIEIARCPNEKAQQLLWATARGGGRTVRSLRAGKMIVAEGRDKYDLPTIEKALRTGRQFSNALKAVDTDAYKLPEVAAFTVRLGKLLTDLESARGKIEGGVRSNG